MNISIVVPVYNSSASLPLLVERVNSVFDELADNFELILVNDGSSDDSWKIITDQSKMYDWIHPINLMRNYGQHNALLCGIRHAKYEITVTMDDDLQNPPEEVPKLLDKLNDGCDVVYGYPQKEQHGLWRNTASKITKIALQSAMGVQTARNVSAFRVFRTQARDAFEFFKSPSVSIDVLLTWATTSFSSVPVRHAPREIGVSNYSLRKLIMHAMNMLTGFSILPLQIASLLGFIFMFFGLILFAYVLMGFIYYGRAVPGFTFIASILTMFSGVQLFVLGIIGEYLARIHFRSFDKPPYVISKKK